MLDAAILVVFPLCMAMAAFSDMLTMKIPNRVSIILAASFFVVAPLTGMDLQTLAMHVAAAMTVFVACFALFAFNVMGGGDAKVLSASALWFGFGQELIAYLGLTGILGGFLALGVLVMRANQDVLLVSPIRIPMHFFRKDKGIPYGMAIGLAAFMTYPETALVKAVFDRIA